MSFPSLNVVVVANVFVAIVLVVGVPPPANIEGPDFADVPPPDLGAYPDISKG
jgi:hypothetical protein